MTTGQEMDLMRRDLIIEDIHIIKPTNIIEPIRTIKIKNQITIKIVTIAADMVRFSIGETIEEEIILKAVIEEISSGFTTIISIFAIFSRKDIKTTKKQ